MRLAACLMILRMVATMKVELSEDKDAEVKDKDTTITDKDAAKQLDMDEGPRGTKSADKAYQVMGGGDAGQAGGLRSRDAQTKGCACR